MFGIGSGLKKLGRNIEKTVSDGWHKSGLDDLWNQWGQRLVADFATGGLNEIKELAEGMVPDIPDPETEAPGAGVQTSQSSMLSDSLAVDRRRRAARYAMADTNRTGSASMRTSVLKSTLG